MRYSPTRLLLSLGTLMSLSGCIINATGTTDPTPTSSAVIAREACRDLVLDYAYYRDLGDAEAFGDLFSNDATLIVSGERFRGREAIAARLDNWQAQPITRHLMSTIRIFPESATAARGVSYATVYAAPRPNPSASETPVRVQGFAALGEYHDEFQLTDAGWKISRREFKAIMQTDD